MLLVATAVMWVRSYCRFDHLEWRGSGWTLFAESGGGQFRIEHLYPYDNSSWVTGGGLSYIGDRPDGSLELGARMPGSRSHFRFCGFWLVSGERWGHYHHALFLPAWFVFGSTVLLPGLWLTRRRGARSLSGRCTVCGYDLRATPERCPECGTATTPAAVDLSH